MSLALIEKPLIQIRRVCGRHRSTAVWNSPMKVTVVDELTAFVLVQLPQRAKLARCDKADIDRFVWHPASTLR